MNRNTLNRIEIYFVPTARWILCCPQISVKTLNLIFLTFDLCFKITGDIRRRSWCSQLHCITSLRKSRMICWSSEVLDSWDSRFARFCRNKASNLALALFCCCTSRGSSASFCRSRSISGPVAEWAARDSSNISRYCCASWTNLIKCWCDPACSWLWCCVTSFWCSAWRLSSTRKDHVLPRLVSIILMSFPLPIFLAGLQELDLLLEKIEMTVPSVFVKIACLLLLRVAQPCVCTL